MTEDRILIPVDANFVAKLERICERDIDVMDTIIDKALAGDPATWRRPDPEEYKVLSDVVFCSCCKPGPCRHQFAWRNIVRCGCDGAGVYRSRVAE